MIIKKIILNNFRQFKGKQEILFSHDQEKNVTVILSDKNGAGKTTLLESFNWCFYRNLNLPNSKEILTREIADNLDEGKYARAYVEIHINHKNHDYIVKRENVYQRNFDEIKRQERNFTMKMKKNDGTLKNINTKEIENIIPEELSTYFFFDGERIENLSEENRQGKKDIGDAVKGILGLDILFNANKHLDKIIKKYDNEYDDKNNEEMKKLKAEFKKLDNQKEEYEKLVKTQKNEKELLTDKIKEIDKFLRDHGTTKNLQIKRDNLTAKIKSQEEHIDRLYKNIERLNKNKLSDFIADRVINVFNHKFDFEKLKCKGIPGIDGEAIDELISRGECICGHKIENGSSEHEKLLKQKSFQPPASLGTIITQFNEKLQNCESNAKDFIEEVIDTYKDIQERLNIIENSKEKLEEISKKLINKEDVVKNKEQERENLEKDKKEVENKLIEYTSKLQNIEKEIKEIDKKLDKLALNNNKNREILLKKRYAKKINNEVRNYYNKKEKQLLEKLNNNVTYVFKNLIETNHKIQINEDYTFDVIDVDGVKSTSTGQNVITTLAFIGGIIKLAKTQHDDIDLTEEYPLILDAPLSDLSSGHKKNVATVIPNITEQLIMFTLKKDYVNNFESIIKNKVGQIYKLKMEYDKQKYTSIERGRDA